VKPAIAVLVLAFIAWCVPLAIAGGWWDPWVPQHQWEGQNGDPRLRCDDGGCPMPSPAAERK
jgi:hypothetical protein